MSTTNHTPLCSSRPAGAYGGCTDILPGHLADMLVEYGLKTPTYAGAARVINRHLA